MGWVGLVWVMGQNEFGLEWVWVETSQLKKRLFWFGSKWVRVGTGRVFFLNEYDGKIF